VKKKIRSAQGMKFLFFFFPQERVSHFKTEDESGNITARPHLYS
jgi:hypothetical protein